MVSAAVDRAPAVAGDVLFALWAWMAGVVIVSLFASVLGQPARACALAAALALAPAVAMLLLAPRWGEKWAEAVAIDSWTASAAAAVALTGGAASPVSAVFLIGPALALRVAGPGRAGEAAAIAVAGFAVAALMSAVAGVAGPSPAAGAFTVLALALAGWLMARAAPARAPAAVATPVVSPSVPAPQVPPVQAPAPQGAALLAGFAEAAHELRTPLGHIIGFAELMQRQIFGPLPAKYAEYVDLILSSGRRMNALASDWLDAGRIASGRYAIQREALDLAAIVREAAVAAGFAAQARGQTVRAVGADAGAPFFADARAVRQILDNLLANAVKFSPPGGTITARLIAGPNAAILDVEDEGPGIPAADRARLGRAFERGVHDGAVEGAGLGLMIVGALAEAHGGRLDILDAEGGGALMRVMLPAVQAPT
ncbi:MAG: HAMP domain-containing sensor histidine kinase [Hyphomonadaceae bacterium]|nr:HAMP domain-containing sensor histidine kinase [Hyphomonadaceae bacterium]